MRTNALAPLLVVLLASSHVVAGPNPNPGGPKPPKPVPMKPAVTQVGPHWTAATPDAMADAMVARLKTRGADSLASLVVLYSMADRAEANKVRGLLDTIASGKDDIAEQARWLSATLSPTGAVPPAGLVTGLSVLGPFQDTTGRLNEKDIDEENPQVWADKNATYSWGAYEVQWRTVETGVSARGVPLGLYVSPRKESCSYLASRVTITKPESIVMSVYSGGSVRLIWDGQTVAKGEDLNPEAIVDRIAARVEATQGDHLLAVKVCSGAPDDDGRVRLRLSSTTGTALNFSSSPDLSPLAQATFPNAKNPKAPKLRVTPVKTALQKALEAPTKTPGEALLAAIVRSKGGGEDARSPKASALVEKVATDPSSSADMIAMAGWVSPFGAVRSGWLNKAQAKAAAEGDHETANFAIRRIAAARIDGGFGDWAMAALGSEPFVKSTDSEAVMLRAMAKASVGGEGGRKIALTELKTLKDSLGGKASIGLLDLIVQYARGTEPKVELSTRKEIVALSPERAGSEYVNAHAFLGGDEIIKAAKEVLTNGTLISAYDVANVAGLLSRADRNQATRDVAMWGIKHSPNTARLYLLLADALYTLNENKNIADAATMRAKDLEPGDPALRAQVAFRAGKGSQKESDKLNDERWMVPAETFLKRVKDDPAKKGEVAERQPHWVRVVTLTEDRRVAQLIHYAREIVIAPRTQEELYENVPNEGDDTEIIRARVHRVDGSIAFAEEQKSEGGRPVIRWPELKTGDVVEVAVRAWVSTPIGRRADPPFYFFDFAGASSTTPLMYNEVIFNLPKDKPLAVDVLNGKADRVVSTDEGERKITRYIWDKPMIVADEPLAPKPSETVPTIIVSTFGSWDDFRNWYRGAVEGFTEPDAQVREIAEKLTKGKTTKEEKLKALFDFVADDIRYVNYVSGEFWLPNRPSQLLARRQGDCDDKALLLITLLKAVGIEATEVLIQTRYTAQPNVLRSKKSAVPLFDHGIAYIPAKGNEPAIWLDATSPQSRLGPLPSMDSRTLALFVSEGAAEMVKTPSSSPDEHGADARWTITLDEKGGAKLEAEELHRGDGGFLLRSNLREADARAPWVEQNLVAGWIPQVEVAKNVDFVPDTGRGTAKVKYSAVSNAIARAEGRDLVVTMAPASTMTSMLAPLPKRTLPVVLPPNLAPSKQSYTVRLVAPPNMKPGDLPSGGDENGNDFGRAKLDIQIDPNDKQTVLITRSVTFDMNEIPVDKYEAWRAWLSRVDSLLHRSVRFVPNQ